MADRNDPRYRYPRLQSCVVCVCAPLTLATQTRLTGVPQLQQVSSQEMEKKKKQTAQEFWGARHRQTEPFSKNRAAKTE